MTCLFYAGASAIEPEAKSSEMRKRKAQTSLMMTRKTLPGLQGKLRFLASRSREASPSVFTIRAFAFSFYSMLCLMLLKNYKKNFRSHSWCPSWSMVAVSVIPLSLKLSYIWLTLLFSEECSIDAIHAYEFERLFLKKCHLK